ncbi:MAG: hypothetical protein KDD46_00225 [Bdellovibrionales bacterium]|nr:hypothetical protein [Bdellovibrionales bacterium]
MDTQKRQNIISDLIKSDFEYKRLFEEHQDLEERLAELDKQKYLSLEEERLRKELQKKKLSGRDIMEKKIIAKFEALA